MRSIAFGMIVSLLGGCTCAPRDAVTPPSLRAGRHGIRLYSDREAEQFNRAFKDLPDKPRSLAAVFVALDIDPRRVRYGGRIVGNATWWESHQISEHYYLMVSGMFGADEERATGIVRASGVNGVPATEPPAVRFSLEVEPTEAQFASWSEATLWLRFKNHTSDEISFPLGDSGGSNLLNFYNLRFSAERSDHVYEAAFKIHRNGQKRDHGSSFYHARSERACFFGLARWRSARLGGRFARAAARGIR